MKKIYSVMIISVLVLAFTLSTVSAGYYETDEGERHNITVESTDKNNNNHWEFNGVESEYYKKLYYYTLITGDDGEPYYLTATDSGSMWKQEPVMNLTEKAIRNVADNSTISNIYKNKQYGVKKTQGKSKYTNALKHGFEFKVSNDMIVEYKQGENIGLNNNTKDITHIWIDGEKIF